MELVSIFTQFLAYYIGRVYLICNINLLYLHYSSTIIEYLILFCDRAIYIKFLINIRLRS